MSVLIKGMEMPTSCANCKLRIAVVCCGNLPHNTRMPNCPLVEIPPHGRLGDLDAAVELVMQYCPDDDGSCSKADFDLRELLDEIEGLPTIIPAEEGE